jgi:hypothetical protein
MQRRRSMAKQQETHPRCHHNVFFLFTRKLSPLTHLFLIINGIKIIPSLEVSFLGFLLETPN